MMAAVRPPSFFGSTLPPRPLFFPGGRPCGKVGNAASSRFPLFHQGGSPFFLFATFSFFANNQCFRRLFRRFDRSHPSPDPVRAWFGWLSRSFQFPRSACRCETRRSEESAYGLQSV